MMSVILCWPMLNVILMECHWEEWHKLNAFKGIVEGNCNGNVCFNSIVCYYFSCVFLWVAVCLCFDVLCGSVESCVSTLDWLLMEYRRYD